MGCGETLKECPEQQPGCEIGKNAAVGTSFCTYSPNYDCYDKGWPVCGASTSNECPEQQPGCEIKAGTDIDSNYAVGTSFCTYAPDYDCYDTGWPECCEGNSTECPEEQPGCEIENEIDSSGAVGTTDNIMRVAFPVMS